MQYYDCKDMQYSDHVYTTTVIEKSFNSILDYTIGPEQKCQGKTIYTFDESFVLLYICKILGDDLMVSDGYLFGLIDIWIQGGYIDV